MKTATVLFLVALISVEMNISCALSSTKKLLKPGLCPKTSPGSGGLCIDQCLVDRSCPGKMKCCRNGCANVCKVPVFKSQRLESSLREAGIDQGSCPSLQMCLAFGTCVSTCSEINHGYLDERGVDVIRDFMPSSKE
ncbi:WAP four-disulfide core domain protein 18-like [Arvicanthis niloticus]|uniref:WAP four-disulfide core domain protein 18-like n=1 Tax=Arvicanthis niloticus TaxID=61156 RepID=UPI0014860F93|nr:WAP four-disulfide core domain protein 18-like [Arvicanthis niloticus]